MRRGDAGELFVVRCSLSVEAGNGGRRTSNVQRTTGNRERCAWLLLVVLGLLLGAGTAGASGPRWVTGPPYFTAPAGNPVVWFTTHPLYFTDPGDLSASVNHATADAMVAAAADTWNIPTSAMVIAYGGALNQHVSAANAYLGSNGPVFP